MLCSTDKQVEKTEIHFIVLEKIQTIKSTLVKMAQRKTRIIMFSKLELFHKCGQSLIRFTLLLNLSFPIYCSCDIKLLEVIRRHPENVEKTMVTGNGDVVGVYR